MFHFLSRTKTPTSLSLFKRDSLSSDFSLMSSESSSEWLLSTFSSLKKGKWREMIVSEFACDTQHQTPSTSPHFHNHPTYSTQTRSMMPLWSSVETPLTYITSSLPLRNHFYFRSMILKPEAMCCGEKKAIRSEDLFSHLDGFTPGETQRMPPTHAACCQLLTMNGGQLSLGIIT